MRVHKLIVEIPSAILIGPPQNDLFSSGIALTDRWIELLRGFARHEAHQEIPAEGCERRRSAEVLRKVEGHFEGAAEFRKLGRAE